MADLQCWRLICLPSSWLQRKRLLLQPFLLIRPPCKAFPSFPYQSIVSLSLVTTARLFIFWKKIKCRFDKIINKEIPSKVVYEDDKVLPCSLTYVWFRIPEVHLWYRVAISILYGYKICYEMYKLLFFWTFFIYL